ncbi:hypothetical protein [Nonomuraea guangzhouensis]|uniref:PE domain-containing protein n=1 Tax=Nonomuraea guangzhouensis TaxID=1291555 RepID=A0ABW4GUK7_9ACTN|nr:hypothetical protein [Nonomuraea guangzhouensis]
MTHRPEHDAADLVAVPGRVLAETMQWLDDLVCFIDAATVVQEAGDGRGRQGATAASAAGRSAAGNSSWAARRFLVRRLTVTLGDARGLAQTTMQARLDSLDARVEQLQARRRRRWSWWRRRQR